MVLDKMLITISGIFLIVFIYWFFLFKNEKKTKARGFVDIIVNGGYSPEVISIPFGKTTSIHFTRTDPTDCLSEVILGDFKIRRELPLNQKVTVEITPKKRGEFIYSCGMGMYHGRIIVE